MAVEKKQPMTTAEFFGTICEILKANMQFPSEILDYCKEYLQPLPARDIIDTYLTPIKYKVSNEALIRYGDSRYSVDPKLIGEEVTADLLDNKLYIYYNGKLVTFHSLNENPINYHENHYKSLMTGKVRYIPANMYSMMELQLHIFAEAL